MEKKRVVPLWISVVLLALLAAGIVMNLFTIPDSWSIPLKIFDTLACVCALFYCLKGYSKNAAVFFKAFCVVYSVSLVIPVFLIAGIYQSGDLKSICLLALRLITFTCSIIFVIASDLGKKKSYILAGINMVVTLATIVTVVGMPVGFVLGMVGKNTLAVVFFIMIYAKYRDKAARNAK